MKSKLFYPNNRSQASRIERWAQRPAPPPRHYNVDHARIRIGKGSAAWDRAVEAVRAWQMLCLSFD